MKRVVAPAAVAALLLLLAFVLESYGGGAAETGFAEVPAQAVTVIRALLWFVGAWFLKRLIEYAFLDARTPEGERRFPKLVFDLIGVLLLLGALIGVVGVVFDMPVQGLLTTSGLLGRVGLFAGLTEAERLQLADRLAVVKYPAGAAIVREDEPGESLFVLFTGLAGVTRATAEGKTEVGRVHPGEVFGEMSLLTGRPRRFRPGAHRHGPGGNPSRASAAAAGGQPRHYRPAGRHTGRACQRPGSGEKRIPRRPGPAGENRRESLSETPDFQILRYRPMNRKAVPKNKTSAADHPVRAAASMMPPATAPARRKTAMAHPQ